MLFYVKLSAIQLRMHRCICHLRRLVSIDNTHF
ncbi:unnamed protein product [Anisakis simplex]|uniref:Uncharacterized protein n=1 Tax=Anisakis simplex TaxID=6269 RepID=A0A3P6NSS9_ANISI|nr:unnamed protein product [Anisakis simplex]